MTFSDEPSDDFRDPTPDRKPADARPDWAPPVEAERNGADADSHDSGMAGSAFTAASSGLTPQLVPAPPPDPAWNGWDILRLTILSVAALFVGVFTVLVVARVWLYPHRELADLTKIPLVIVAGQCLAYVLIFIYMYVLVTRERRRRDFLNAIHWNWPSNVATYVAAGFALALALQGVAHLLPMPKQLPIDSFFQTRAEAWALSILSVTFAPLMEELFFRGFLYPVLARSIGVPIAILLTSIGFAALHGAQLMFSWGPVLVIFLVGLVLTMVRAKTNSVGAGVLMHMAYNGTITVAMFAATDGFRHLEKLNQ